MPFRETGVVEERIAMFREFDAGCFSVSEVTARYGVSPGLFCQEGTRSFRRGALPGHLR
jgi:hypothetical protein